MAAGVTITGLTEFKAGVEQLPRAITLALRGVAWKTSRRVKDLARARLQSQTHGTGKTAAALRITERDQMKAFIVDVGPVPGRPDNLALWLELGTVKMSARPFLRPALEETNPAYIRECDAAVQATGEQVLG